MEADLIVTCPYDPAHRIRKYKLSDHMVKCKKHSAVVNKVTCPLNSKHVVDADRLREHIAYCDSLGKLVEDVDIGVNQAPNPLPIIVDSNLPREDWSQDPEIPSYDPMLSSAERKVMRCISGLSKSEKKQFRESERMRIANLREIGTAKPGLPFSEDAQRSLCFPRKGAVFSKKENAEPGTSIKVSKADKIHNESIDNKFNEFQKKLYNELVSECDDTSRCEEFNHALYKFDANVSANSNSQRFKDKSFSMFVQEPKTKDKEVEINATCEIFDVNNTVKEETKDIESAFDIKAAFAHEQNIDKFSALVRNNVDVKIKPAAEAKNIDEETNKQFMWEKIFSKFNERLAYVTDIQNTAAEESARLLEQLKDLKLHQDIVPKK